jgi:hypothetical protein
MRRIILVSLFCMTAAGCQSAPEDSRPASAAAPEGRGGEMPASLRCRQPADCVQKPSCYWDTPACVASASVVGDPEKCSGDADPADAQHQPVRCDCFEGQCTVKSTP